MDGRISIDLVDVWTVLLRSCLCNLSVRLWKKRINSVSFKNGSPWRWFCRISMGCGARPSCNGYYRWASRFFCTCSHCSASCAPRNAHGSARSARIPILQVCIHFTIFLSMEHITKYIYVEYKWDGFIMTFLLKFAENLEYGLSE